MSERRSCVFRVLAEFECQVGHEHLEPDLLGTPEWSTRTRIFLKCSEL